MKIHHAALYVTDLEGMRAFYETYFGASANAMYHNPCTGLQTYFLSFEDGARLEIMTRPEMSASHNSGCRTGYIHVAYSVGSREAVDSLTARILADGYPVLSGPRTTGDGYYESCVLDPEGNQIEITI